MHINVYFTCRRISCCPVDSRYCIHGKSKPYKLSEEDIHLFHASNEMVPQLSVKLYKKIHLIASNRIITVTMKARKKRDNSGIIFMNKAAGVLSYGRLEKVLCFYEKDVLKAYVVIEELSISSNQLCKDVVTNSKLNDHIVVLNNER